MSELKPEVETVLKTGRQIVERKQVDFPDSLSKQLDAIKQLYNELGAQVLLQLNAILTQGHWLAEWPGVPLLILVCS